MDSLTYSAVKRSGDLNIPSGILGILSPNKCQALRNYPISILGTDGFSLCSYHCLLHS